MVRQLRERQPSALCLLEGVHALPSREGVEDSMGAGRAAQQPVIKRGFDNLWHTCAHRLSAYGVPEADRNLILGRSQLENHSTTHLMRLLDAAERITIRRETPAIRIGSPGFQHNIGEHAL